MEHNQNKINHQRAIRIKFLTFLSVAEKTGRGREVILAVGEQFSGRCRCREV